MHCDLLLLSRLPIAELCIYNLPSKVTKKVLIADILINHDILTVGNVQFESQKYPKTRIDQAEIVSTLLNARKHAKFEIVNLEITNNE